MTKCAYNVGTVAEVLGTFEQAVLLEILRLRDEAYGRAILKAVQERLERELPERPIVSAGFHASAPLFGVRAEARRLVAVSVDRRGCGATGVVIRGAVAA